MPSLAYEPSTEVADAATAEAVEHLEPAQPAAPPAWVKNSCHRPTRGHHLRVIRESETTAAAWRRAQEVRAQRAATLAAAVCDVVADPTSGITSAQISGASPEVLAAVDAIAQGRELLASDETGQPPRRTGRRTVIVKPERRPA